jgi:hypothetical protein
MLIFIGFRMVSEVLKWPWIFIKKIRVYTKTMQHLLIFALKKLNIYGPTVLNFQEILYRKSSYNNTDNSSSKKYMSSKNILFFSQSCMKVFKFDGILYQKFRLQWNFMFKKGTCQTKKLVFGEISCSKMVHAIRKKS